MSVFRFLLIGFFIPGSAAPVRPLKTITIVAPQGTSNHGDSHLLCTPTKPSDIAIFIFGNFVAHAMTLKSLPGEAIIPSFLGFVFALLFPVSGVCRGLNAIIQHAITRKNPIDTAVAAEAVCEVVRTKYWRPKDSQALINNIKIEKTERHGERKQITVSLEKEAMILLEGQEKFIPSLKWNSITGRKVHGKLNLPVGYALAVIPRDSKIIPFVKRGDTLGESDLRMVEEVSNFLPVCEPACTQFSRSSKEEDSYTMESRIEIAGVAEVNQESNTETVLNETKNKIQSECKENRRYFEPTKPGQESRSSLELASHYNLVKSLMAIFQLCYAGFTLMQARGDQISQYGYTAYGLSVIPYLIMSGINLLSSALTPDYSHVYLVRTDIMTEAEDSSGAQFSGVIGELPSESRSCSDTISAYFEQAEDETWHMRPSAESSILAMEKLGPVHSNGRYKVKWAKDKTVVYLSILWIWIPLFLFQLLQALFTSDRLTVRSIRHTFSAILSSINRGSLSRIWHKLRHTRRRKNKNMIISISSRSSLRSASRGSIQVLILFVGSILIGCISIAVNGAMSHFKQGTDSSYAYTITYWLCLGIVAGPFSLINYEQSRALSYLSYIETKMLLLFYGLPAIFGLVTLGRMMSSYGNCIRVF